MKSYEDPATTNLSNEQKHRSLKLDWNEYLFDHHSEVKKLISGGIQMFDVTYYPEFDRSNIKGGLRDFLQFDNCNVVLGNGSDDIIRHIIVELSQKYSSLFALNPEYSQHFETAQRFGLDVVRQELDLGNEITTKHIFQMIRQCDSQIVYLSNPHNPTGHCAGSQELIDLIKSLPTKIFLIDEAYADFDRCSIVDSIARLNNVIVTRSFSKSFGLAGLRLGYAVFPNNFKEDVGPKYNKKNVSQIALKTIQSVLNNVEFYENEWDVMIRNREYLIGVLDKLGFRVIHGKGNFVSILVPPGNFLVEFMKNSNIFVRKKSISQSYDYELIRITVPNKDDLNLLESCLTNYCHEFPNFISAD